MIKVIHHGRIYLERGKFCEALIIDEGRIVKTGASRDLLEEAPSRAEKIDAEGALVLPAFNDSHLHLAWLGRRAGSVEGKGAGSIGELIRRGRELIARLNPPSGAYVEGDGINPDLFSSGEKRDPVREDLDKISTVHPLVFSRHCGHTIYCNSLALKLAGISESAPTVEGGAVEKDKNGRPSGVLRENAASLVRNTMPAPSKEALKGFLSQAMKKAHALGITSCGSYDSGGDDFENVLEAYRGIYDESLKAGVPALRVAMQCGISSDEETLDARAALGGRRPGTIPPPLWETPGWGTFLKIGCVKLFLDGTLGGRTAWMREPYRDSPGTRGFPVLSGESLEAFIKKADSAGMQTLVHAIGDAGVACVLDAFEKVTSPGRNPLRHGIIHCQITTPDLLERMARNNILALVQPIFLADDISILEHRVGPEKALSSYAWASMAKLGIPVSYGTDAPISSLDPLLNIRWAVLRAAGREGGDESFGSAPVNIEERVDVYTAVDACTAGPAYSTRDEAFLGRAAPGFLADLVFLDKDIFSIPPEDIHKAGVRRTICAGETVYLA